MNDFIDLLAIMCGVFFIFFFLFNKLFKMKRGEE